ncbi:membrane protein [Companilactobacillus sp. RD055328]|uniref:DUF975 family protein n=1 Tax=Companilactobacillus sp. RD055328 TaxID=2916634 RepID=UPI001FC8A825|nr:DUF975 family protein [Companilactobacillus sp. RD055328]GKQ43099.1 membrane protein [Companilactobacillus sp. RD055328]
MKKARELRAQVRETFKDNWGKAIVMCLLPTVYLISAIFITVIVAFIIGFIITMITKSQNIGFAFSFVSIYVAYIILIMLLSLLFMGVRFKFIDWTKNPELEFSAPMSVFNIFKYNIWMIIKISLWQFLFIFLWSLLFVIPGIIKSFSYSQAFNLYKLAVDEGNDNQYKAIDYITQSRNIMDGYKGRLFYLQLTFIGWMLLACLTMGIGNLWLTPYIMASESAFFNDLIENNKSVLTDK